MNKSYEKFNHLQNEDNYFSSLEDWQLAVIDAKNFILEALGAENFLEEMIQEIGLVQEAGIFDNIIRIYDLLYDPENPDE